MTRALLCPDRLTPLFVLFVLAAVPVAAGAAVRLAVGAVFKFVWRARREVAAGGDGCWRY